VLLLIGKELPNVPRDLEQLLGPAEGRSTKAVHVFPVNAVFLHRIDQVSPFLLTVPCSLGCSGM
jgi:hypothetical protein